MPREIVWLPEAARDVVRLRTFIQEKNPQAAQRAASRIKEAVQILKENPEAGRPVEEVLSFRDLIIPFGIARKRDSKHLSACHACCREKCDRAIWGGTYR
jgi:plasmid stabilization system protein ParE